MSFSICVVLVLSMLVNNHSTVSAKSGETAGRANVTKSIEWTDFSQGLATVTINVETIGGEYQYDEVVPTSIVLVLDGSISMSYAENKLQNMKKAAIDFASNMLSKAPAGKLKIAVVGFNEGIKVTENFTDSLEDIKNAVNKITAKGSSNLQGAMKKAEDMLADVQDQNKYMVLLSDGAPNYSYAVTDADITVTDQEDTCKELADGTIKHGVKVKDITYQVKAVDYKKVLQGINWQYQIKNPFHKEVAVQCADGETVMVDVALPDNNGVATLFEAEQAKKAGINIYSIAYEMTEADAFPGVELMEKLASKPSQTYTSKMSEEEIEQVFNSIQTSIIKEIGAGKNAVLATKGNDLFVVDSNDVCEDVAYTVLPETITCTKGNATANPSTNEVKWELGDLPHESSTFTLTYQVKIDVTDIDSSNVINADESTLSYDKFDGTGESTVSTTVDSNQDNLEFYRVVFKNADKDNTVLKTEYVLKNGDATVPKDPTIANTAQYTYTFAGWDGTYKNVTSDQIVVAKYTNATKQYTVTFVDENGTTVLGKDVVNYGEAATYSGKGPSKSPNGMYTYLFSGWDKDYSHITADLTVKATYQPVVSITDPTAPENNPTPENDPTKNDPTTIDTTKNDPTVNITDEDTPASGTTLPETGTTPVSVFYFVGAMFIVVGASVLAVKKVKRA